MAKTAQEHFEDLARLLPSRPLRTRDGDNRVADVGEFMFMGEYDGVVQFKHYDTRNYVLIDGGKLVVPDTGLPFHRGYF